MQPTARSTLSSSSIAARALVEVARDGPSVIVLGLHAFGDDCWSVLETAGVRLVRVGTLDGALRALRASAAQVVIADADRGPALTAAVRKDDDLASTHVLLCAALDSKSQLRAALDAGADDVMRLPFEPEVLAARVAGGLRAARLRENETLLHSLVTNIPGAVYRCAWDRDWTMQWLSDEIEQISGYPASDFVANAVRTFASVIHPDDQDQVEQSVAEAVQARRPFTLEYRIRRRHGDERWVLERGQAQESGDGRLWLDGAIFDITARRAAEHALRERDVAEAQLAEVRASRARILDAADRARLEIEHNLHDGAQQRFVSIALRLQIWLAAERELSEDSRTELGSVLADLRLGLAELRDLAHGLHPAVLTDRGLAHALSSLANRAAVPIELDVALAARPASHADRGRRLLHGLRSTDQRRQVRRCDLRVGERHTARRPPRGRGRRRRRRRSTPARGLGASGPPRPDRRRRRDAARPQRPGRRNRSARPAADRPSSAVRRSRASPSRVPSARRAGPPASRRT